MKTDKIENANSWLNKKIPWPLGIIVILAFIIIIVSPAYHPRGARKTACQKNLEHLYTTMFRYCNMTNHGDNFPNLRGQAFWEVLLTMPTPETSILADDRRKHTYYICPVMGGAGNYDTNHYRGPNYEVTYGIPYDMPIAADFPDNHGDDTINVLYFDGTVKEVKKGTPEWDRVEKYTIK
jgi:hypothetical protein